MRRAAAGLALVICITVLAVLAGACRGRRFDASGPEAAAVPRFPHRSPAHAPLACTACHAADDVRAGRPARPGAADHAPCDQSGCHAEDFRAAPGPLCSLCHDEVEPWRTGGTTPAPYPPALGARAMPSAFSHAAHLDKARLDSRVGFHVSCADCHLRRAGGDDVELPGHTECARCHVAGKARPALDDCAGCHGQEPSIPRERRLIRGDVGFHHARHEQDRKSRPIACVDCHRDIAKQSRAAQRATPETAACVACHDDEARTPTIFSMSRCETCHTDAQGAALSLVAPRSHLPPRDRPDSHTLAFRKDHGADARRDPAGCASCHGGLSGLGDNCDECHQVMRPNDHFAGFGERHGLEAAADAQRCARCHAGDFCTTCHARPPRSHLPLAAFRSPIGSGVPGHAAPARANMRACLVCHEPERDCTGLGCHDSEVRP